MNSLVVILLLKLGSTLFAEGPVVKIGDMACKPQLLQYYGLGGLMEPTPYSVILQHLNADFCPGIEYSCCTHTDFDNAMIMWEVKVVKIKRYLSKMYHIVQKVTLLQPSLLSVASSIQGNPSKYCREIDSTFFNNPIHYNEIYFYLQNSIEAFAFMQKGFYCAICNAKNHQYLAVETGTARKVAVMDVQFCNDLIFFFREYIMFKTYFLDPLIVNTNYLLNCHNNSKKFEYEFEYMTTYHMIEGCVEKGENCEYVCKEFRFGGSSELFIGNLKKFYEFYENVEKLLSDFKTDYEEDEKEEFKIEEEDYPSDFFTIGGPSISAETNTLLNDYDLTTFDINIATKGINLFDIAAHSNFFITNAMSRTSMMKNFGLHKTATSSAVSSSSIEFDFGEEMEASVTGNETVQSVAENKERDIKYDHEKPVESPVAPSKTEENVLELERDQLEQDLAEDINTHDAVEADPIAKQETSETNQTAPNKKKSGANALATTITLVILVLFKY